MADSANREFEFTHKDFDYLRKIANNRTGIVVSDDKFNMFYSRLSRRLRVHGFTNFKQYIDFLKTPQGDAETIELINSITTNLTSFFRENHHFEYLTNTAIPELMTRNAAERKIDIWSSGCSTGEEPYSIAMTLLESTLANKGWATNITATDIDSNVLSHAASGVYRLDRVNALPKPKLRRFFLKGKGGQAGNVRLKSDVRKMIKFSQLNLMDDWKMPQVDILFCRNVIIYFDKDTKTRLVERYADVVKDGGYLFIGHSESLYNITDRFKLIGNTIYQKVG